jgi:hypothetical protein
MINNRGTEKTGQLLYAKKGAVVYYYKDSDLSEIEEGLSVRSGGVVGTYFHSSNTGIFLHVVYWPATGGLRYVDASLVDWVDYRTGKADTLNTVYDPVKVAQSKLETFDNQFWSMIAITILLIKKFLRKKKDE